MVGQSAIRAGKAEILLRINDQVSAGLRSVERRLQTFAAGVAKAGAAFTVAGGAITAGVFGPALRQFAQAEQLFGRFDAVFGNAAESASEFARVTANSLNVSQLPIKDTLSFFQAVNLGAGLAEDEAAKMSQALTVAAQDLVAFDDTLANVEEATRRLAAGLAGETEPVRRFGADVRATAIEARLAAQDIDKAYKDLTEGERRKLRFEIILEALARGGVTGQARREVRTLQSRIRQLSDAFRDLGVAIGSTVGKQFANFFGVLVNFQKALTAIVTRNEQAVRLFGALGTAVAGLGGSMLSLSVATSAVSFALEGVFKLIQVIKAPFNAVAAIVRTLAEDFQLLGNAAVGFAVKLGEGAVALASSAISGFRSGIESLVSGFGTAFVLANRLIASLFTVVDTANLLFNAFAATGDSVAQLGTGVATATALIPRSANAITSSLAGVSKALNLLPDAADAVVTGLDSVANTLEVTSNLAGSTVDAMDILSGAVEGSVAGFNLAAQSIESLNAGVAETTALIPRTASTITKAVGGITSSLNLLPDAADAIVTGVSTPLAVIEGFADAARGALETATATAVIPRSASAVTRTFEATAASLNVLPDAADAVVTSFGAIAQTFDLTVSAANTVTDVLDITTGAAEGVVSGFNVAAQAIESFNGGFADATTLIPRTAKTISTSIGGVADALNVLPDVADNVVTGVAAGFQVVDGVAKSAADSLSILGSSANAAVKSFDFAAESAKSAAGSIGIIPDVAGAVTTSLDAVADSFDLAADSAGAIGAIISSPEFAVNGLNVASLAAESFAEGLEAVVDVSSSAAKSITSTAEIAATSFETVSSVVDSGANAISSFADLTSAANAVISGTAVSVSDLAEGFTGVVSAAGDASNAVTGTVSAIADTFESVAGVADAAVDGISAVVTAAEVTVNGFNVAAEAAEALAEGISAVTGAADAATDSIEVFVDTASLGFQTTAIAIEAGSSAFSQFTKVASEASVVVAKSFSTISQVSQGLAVALLDKVFQLSNAIAGVAAAAATALPAILALVIGATALSAVGAVIGTVLSGLFIGIARGFAGVVGSIKEIADAIASLIGNSFRGLISSIGVITNVLGPELSAIWGEIASNAGNAFDRIIKDANRTFSVVGKLIENQDYKTAFDLAAAQVKVVLADLGLFLFDTFSRLAPKVQAIFEAIFTSIRNTVVNTVSLFVAQLQAGFSVFKQFFIDPVVVFLEKFASALLGPRLKALLQVFGEAYGENFAAEFQKAIDSATIPETLPTALNQEDIAAREKQLARERKAADDIRRAELEAERKQADAALKRQRAEAAAQAGLVEAANLFASYIEEIVGDLDRAFGARGVFAAFARGAERIFTLPQLPAPEQRFGLQRDAIGGFSASLLNRQLTTSTDIQNEKQEQLFNQLEQHLTDLTKETIVKTNEVRREVGRTIANAVSGAANFFQ